MVPYTITNAALDFIAFASTTIVIVWLISVVQPLFERVRDSCRAGQPPAPRERAIVLWITCCLIPVTWEAAACLYYRHLSLLWECMGIWLAQEPVNRLVYALLHLYLFFLLVCGFSVWALVCFELCRNTQMLKDIFMIARFRAPRDHAVQDTEAQRESPVDTEAENPSTGGNVHNTSWPTQDEDSPRNSQETNGNVAAMNLVNESEHATEEHDSPGLDPFVDGLITRTVHHSTQNVKEVAKNPGPLDSDGDAVTMTPSSPSSFSSGIDELEYVDDDDDRYARRGAKVCNCGCESLDNRIEGNIIAPFTISKSGHSDADEYDDCKCLYYNTPRLDPLNTTTDFEPLNIGPPPSPCDSCSSTHAESIPTAKRSSVRVPITPTSPTADADDADTEKTDVERRKRERRNRVPTLSALPNPFKRA